MLQPPGHNVGQLGEILILARTLNRKRNTPQDRQLIDSLAIATLWIALDLSNPETV